jgi:hypothetical protein
LSLGVFGCIFLIEFVDGNLNNRSLILDLS